MFRFEYIVCFPADATEWKIRMFDFEIYFKVIRLYESLAHAEQTS